MKRTNRKRLVFSDLAREQKAGVPKQDSISIKNLLNHISEQKFIGRVIDSWRRRMLESKLYFITYLIQDTEILVESIERRYPYVEKTKNKRSTELEDTDNYWIHNLDGNKLITYGEREHYFLMGYRPNKKRGVVRKGENNRHFLWVRKDGQELRILKSDLESYLCNGWLKGKKTGAKPVNRSERRVSVNDGKKGHYIDGSEVRKYLSEGWVLGKFKRTRDI